MSDYGSNCDVLGIPYIMTEKLCQKAAEALQLQWNHWTDLNKRPRGCYEEDSGNVFFNRKTEGNIYKETRNICNKSILIIFVSEL